MAAAGLGGKPLSHLLELTKHFVMLLTSRNLPEAWLGQLRCQCHWGSCHVPWTPVSRQRGALTPSRSLQPALLVSASTLHLQPAQEHPLGQRGVQLAQLPPPKGAARPFLGGEPHLLMPVFCRALLGSPATAET